MDKLNIGQLVIYNNTIVRLAKNDPLHNKVGIIVKYHEQKIYSPYLSKEEPLEFIMYHVFIDDNVYKLGDKFLIDIYNDPSSDS